MRVKVFGPSVGYAPAPGGGQAMRSWAPNEVVEVNLDDEAAVAFYRGLVTSGAAELVDEDQPDEQAAAAPVGSEEHVVSSDPTPAALQRPAGNASKADWADWATAAGAAADIAESMTRDDLRDLADSLDAGTATIDDTGEIRYF